MVLQNSGFSGSGAMVRGCKVSGARGSEFQVLRFRVGIDITVFAFRAVEPIPEMLRTSRLLHELLTVLC